MNGLADVGETEVDAGEDEDDDAYDGNGRGKLQSIHRLDGAEREQDEKRNQERNELCVTRAQEANRLVLVHELADVEQLRTDIDDLLEEHVHVGDVNTEVEEHQSKVRKNTNSLVAQLLAHAAVNGLVGVNSSAS